MDHRAFVISLPTQTTAQLNAPNDLASVKRLLVQFGLIGFLCALVAVRVPFWPVFMVPLGILLVSLFTIEHEATHHSVLSTSWLNDWIGRLTGLVLFLPFEWFRYFHLAHHRHTNIPDRDPELAGAGRPGSWADYLIHISGMPYWLSMLRVLISNAFGQPTDDFLPRGARHRVRQEAQSMLVIYLLALLSLTVTPVLLWIWIVPVLLGQPFLRIFLLAEHGHCPTVANMFENTRTTFTTRLVRYFTWNASYHVEHHTIPTVPSHNLPHLHVLMKRHLKVTSDGYSTFAKIYPSGFSEPSQNSKI